MRPFFKKKCYKEVYIASCKVTKDSLGSWTPRFGFQIPSFLSPGFQIPKQKFLGFQIPDYLTWGDMKVTLYN